MDAKKKLALLITTTMLVASPLCGCGKQNPDEKEEQNNSSGSTHVAPGGYFRNNNSNFKSGSGSKGKSWGTPKSGGSYSHGHGGSIGG